MILCKICGSTVRDEVACCSRCFTPHHFDCWSFAGQCSVYACGGREHKYFDFRDKPEADLLAAIGQSLAIALREDAAAPPEPVKKTAAEKAGSSAEELMRYKRGMFRALHAALAKSAPGRLEGDADLVYSYEHEVEGQVAHLFLADDLEVDASSGTRDMSEKKRLLHALASRSNLPEKPRSIGEVLRDWLRALLGRER